MVTDFEGRRGRSLDRFEAVFDDGRVVANAGVLLPATLAGRLGLETLVDETVSLCDRSAGSRPGAKVLSLVHAMLLGADSIDDCDVLRSGETARVLGHRVLAPSTLGRSCGASRSDTCASSTGCSARRSAVPGGPARGPARSGS